MRTEKDIKLKANLKKLLEENSLSLHQLAIKTKGNKSSLHNYLNGVLPQGLIALVKISNLFEISLDELVFQDIKSAVKNNDICDDDDTFVITIKKLKKGL